MKAIIDCLKKHDNLIPLSAGITAGIMLLFFFIAQILAFTGLLKDTDLFKKKMEVRELIKLKFTPQEQPELVENVRMVPQKLVYERPKVHRTERANNRKAEATSNVTSLLQGVDMKKLISGETSMTKRGVAKRWQGASAGISTNVNRHVNTTANFDLKGSVRNQQSTWLTANRSAAGSAQGLKVGIGGTSHVGDGFGSGDMDLSGLGNRASRATRRTGSGTGGAKITLPSGSGSDGVALNLHELIKWMKAHPGAIPKLVAHDMGHRSGELSSAVSFTLNGRSFRLFLSCNEIELLLRICLVEGNNFTLLKDNGIREVSNFLIMGEVVREQEKIRSLISSRRAPTGKAARFYQIFWSWWLQEKEN